MREFTYSNNKEMCWYKKICDKSKCNDFCIRHYKMEYLVNAATLEGKQMFPIDLRPDSVDLPAFKRLREIKQNIKDFVENGNNLLLYSENTGNGKTEWSKKLLLSWFDSIWPFTELKCRGLFISMPMFISSAKENISKENEYYTYVKDNIFTADLIIWDELNYKEWSAFEQDLMLNIISQRLAMGKANVYTTNYSLADIEKRLGTRLVSRIIGGSELVELKGSDKRGWHNG